MGFPLGLFATQLGLCGGWWSMGPMKNIQHSTSSFKKTKRNLSESSSESDDEEITRFPRFIVLEAQDNSPLATLSPFIIEKIISSNLQPKTVKKLRNGNLLVEVEKKRNTQIFC